MAARRSRMPAALAFLMGLAAGLIAPPEAGLAQTSFAPSVQPDRWHELSPADRSEMRRQYLQTLPPREREKLRSQVERFNAMSPSKKRELCRRFEKDRGYLPPACQNLF